jgi:hypothetical protein
VSTRVELAFPVFLAHDGGMNEDWMCTIQSYHRYAHLVCSKFFAILLLLLLLLSRENFGENVPDA